jgi:hypothetical protein
MQVVLLDFAPDHAASYNALVEVIRRNLLLADWCDDAHLEVSLPQVLAVFLARWPAFPSERLEACTSYHGQAAEAIVLSVVLLQLGSP